MSVTAPTLLIDWKDDEDEPGHRGTAEYTGDFVVSARVYETGPDAWVWYLSICLNGDTKNPRTWYTEGEAASPKQAIEDVETMSDPLWASALRWKDQQG